MLSAYELNQVKGMLGTWSIGHIASFYGMILRRPVTIVEAEDAVRRIHAANRDPHAVTYNDVERSTEPAWRSNH